MHSGKDTGVIKFKCNWIKAPALPLELLSEINAWRDKMHAIGFIGVNEEGIGYGNISQRYQEKEFIISGSATGKLLKLSEEHYTRVTDYIFQKNELTATGPILASSESLTHAALYESDKSCNAVIHIHNFQLWEKLIHKVPTSSAQVEYGTPAMALEVKRLFTESDLKTRKFLVMAGHPEGIIVFGKDMNEAGNIILKELIPSK